MGSLVMKEPINQIKKNKGIYFFLPIILIFCILGTLVFSISQKISREMSDSAIQNLSESLDLIMCTIESIFNNETEFQMLIAQELARVDNPEEYVRNYEKNRTIAKISLIMAGQTQGVSNIDEVFSADELDFSAENVINGLSVSQSYVNYMGTWAYSIKCPVRKDGQEIATLYMEYTYDFIDRFLPEGFYNAQATLYIMDAESERFVLKPEGMGKRSAGHLNLDDFYRANNIIDDSLRAEVKDCLINNQNILFYHYIRGVHALNYMWSVNDGNIFLIGYVPVEAIQQEGKTVNHNLILVVVSMLLAFFICCLLYYFSQRQQQKIARERETEREIHNKQLSEALLAAQIASNSKTMFLSNMSHDIRTPMNAVLGFARLLTTEAENPVKVRDYTSKIMASGQHLLSLINDVLDVSKIESGKVVLNIEEFTLNDLVASVDAIIQPMAKAKQQEFYVEVTGIKHEYLLGDETRMNQILINLLSNAVKYTPNGGTIWFRIIGQKQRSNQYEHIRIEVEDNGYGMTPEYLATIFEAFTRAENSTTNKVQGTGLGMAITKNIVELMGGSIDVSSEVNKGSLFKVDLEFRIPEVQMERKFWAESGIRRILAVVEDAETGDNIKTLMDDMGVEVDLALDLPEARQLLAAGQSYQIVLLDWCLPDLAGLSALKQLRSFLPESMPIFCLAAYDTEGLEAALEIENVDILNKPFFVSAFKERLLIMQSGEDEKEDLEPEIEDNLEGLHFLAAEDNEINAEILTEILDMEGASCEIVENGQLAVERFAQASLAEFDAILMDVQMPVMNGYDATRAIRALMRDDAREIPIIAMTANAFAEDEKAALDAGMNAHVAKPIDVDLLKKVIKQYTKREA